MDLTDEYRDKISGAIIVAAANALKEGKVNEAEVSYIASSVIKANQISTTNDQLLAFLEELSNHWEFFKPLYILEKHEGSEVRDEETVKQMQELIRSSKVDEALEVGKESDGGNTNKN